MLIDGAGPGPGGFNILLLLLFDTRLIVEARKERLALHGGDELGSVYVCRGGRPRHDKRLNCTSI
jgi:hypothetical protein